MPKAFFRALFLLACTIPMSAAASITSLEVQKLYVGTFGRPIDPLTQQFYAANAGATVASVGAVFTASQEFQTQIGGMSNAQIVGVIFQNCFGRAATSPDIIFWGGKLDSDQLAVSELVWAVTSGAVGADLTAWDSKVSAAAAFTSSLDTASEINAYDTAAAFAIGKAYITRVYDAATLAAETTGAALSATTQQVVATSYTPTPTITRTFTASPTRTMSPTRSPTPTQTPTASPTRTRTATLTVTPTATPVLSPTPTMSPVTIPGVQGSTAPMVLGPVPAKRGEPVCLGSNKGVASSHWELYNASSPPERLASLSFGAEPQHCLSTGALAPGVYFVDLETRFTDGERVRRWVKIAVRP